MQLAQIETTIHNNLENLLILLGQIIEVPLIKITTQTDYEKNSFSFWNDSQKITIHLESPPQCKIVKYF